MILLDLGWLDAEGNVFAMAPQLLALLRRVHMQHHSFFPLSYSNPVLLIKSSFLVPRCFRFSIHDCSGLGRHLEAGDGIGDPFRASAGELSPLIFALSFSFIWLILFPPLMGNVLHERVMHFLSGYISACSHFHSLLVTTLSCDKSCYHLHVPVQEYHHQSKVTTRVLPPLHIHFVREAGRGLVLRSVVVHKSG